MLAMPARVLPIPAPVLSARVAFGSDGALPTDDVNMRVARPPSRRIYRRERLCAV